MDTVELLVAAFDRITGLVHQVVEDLSPEQLAFRPGTEANTTGWLVWHLTRVQDDHVAEVAGTEQVWLSAGWAERFALPFDRHAIGYGQRADEVAAVTDVSSEMLAGYHDAVAIKTAEYLVGLTPPDLDRVVDEAWDPPVTLGVRLLSVISDDLQHAGQASFVRGIGARCGWRSDGGAVMP